VSLPPDAEGHTNIPYATSHHDSMLFAAAAVLLVSLAIHKATPRAMRLMFTVLPILILGMIFNGRRMVWVQIGMVFLTLFMVTPTSRMKRKIKRYVLVFTPVFALYLVVGWNQKGGIFKPAQTVRSVVDPQTDQSSLTREIEDYDLIYTVKQYPLVGAGYGNGYWEMISLPPMGYPLERFCPHNSLLGMWAICGYVGFTAMTLLWVTCVYFGMRSYHLSTRGTERAAALMSFGVVLIYEIQCWGDMGLGSWTGVFLMGPAITVAGKLAVATGAWGGAKERGKKPAVVASAVAAQPAPAGVGMGGAGTSGMR
jgi:O-antigen ligase